MKRFIDLVADYVHAFNSKRELKDAMSRMKSLARNFKSEDFIKMVFDEPFQRFFWIKQVRSEMTEFCRIVERVKPKHILEIGTASGGSLFLIARHAANDAKLISLDLPGGLFGGGYPEYKSEFYKSFAWSDQDLQLIRGDSHDPQIFEQVKAMLNGKSIDLLFIDGDHSYDGVKHDFEQYSQLVSPSGIIAFHDIVKHGEGSGCDVDEYYNELKLRFPSLDIVENYEQQWAGIGLIFFDHSTLEDIAKTRLA